MHRNVSHGRARRLGRGSRPAVSEILSVIMITVALAIGTGVFLFTFQDRQDVTEEATLGHLDLGRMSASELVTWSSPQCTGDGRLEFLLHNYGEENLSTADIRMYASSMGTTKEVDASAASYFTLSNRTITGQDIRGGETAWASVDLGCDALSGAAFSWECDNPLLRVPAYMGCSGTLLSMVTPAEDIVRVSVDGAGDPPPYPTTSYIVPAATAPGPTTTRLCFDVSGQPSPLTVIEVWSFGRGNFPTATVADNWVANFSGAGIVPGPDAGTSCIDLSSSNAYGKLLRFRMVSDDGVSLFTQRPYAMVHWDGSVVDRLRVANRDALGFESFFHCPNGQVIPADEFNGRC